jgi:predicted DNA-binding transcriptional regulator AlpA
MASSLPVHGGQSHQDAGEPSLAPSHASQPSSVYVPQHHNSSEANQPVPELLDVCQAAKLLSVSRRHFLRMNDAEQVPAPIRLGRSVRWGRTELTSWVQHGCPPRKRWSPMWQTLRGKGVRHG